MTGPQWTHMAGLTRLGPSLRRFVSLLVRLCPVGLNFHQNRLSQTTSSEVRRSCASESHLAASSLPPAIWIDVLRHAVSSLEQGCNA